MKSKNKMRKIILVFIFSHTYNKSLLKYTKIQWCANAEIWLRFPNKFLSGKYNETNISNIKV